MSNNFFSDDNDEEFRDIPDEVGQQDAPPVNVRVQRPAAAPVQEQAKEEYYDHVSGGDYSAEEEQEEDFSSVLSDARLRLEQGKLYELIMNHDIFSGVDADERAIKHVQKQIRNFAREQMEIMLGMRQEAPKVQPLSVDNFPFNDLEVEALKALASAATKGATTAPEAQTFSGVEQSRQSPRVGLNTIGSPKKAAPAAPKPVAPKAAQPQAKPLAQKPAAPVKRDANRDAIIDKILAEEGITRAEYDAQYPPDYKALEKPVEQMSDAELKERARAMRKRSPGQVKNPQAIPMPTIDQENMLHATRAQAAASHPQMQSLMSLLTNSGKK